MRFFVSADDYLLESRESDISSDVSISMMNLAWEAVGEHLAKAAPAAIEHMNKLSKAANHPPSLSWQQDTPGMVLDIDEDDCRALLKELVMADISALAPDLRRSFWELIAVVARGSVNGGLVGY